MYYAPYLPLESKYDYRFRRRITLNYTSTENMFLSLYDIVSYDNNYVTGIEYVEKVLIQEYGHMAGKLVYSPRHQYICKSENFLELVRKYKNEQQYYVMVNITNLENIKINYNDLDTVLKDNYISELYRSMKYKLFLIKHIY